MVCEKNVLSENREENKYGQSADVQRKATVAKSI